MALIADFKNVVYRDVANYDCLFYILRIYIRLCMWQQACSMLDDGTPYTKFFDLQLSAQSSGMYGRSILLK